MRYWCGSRRWIFRGTGAAFGKGAAFVTGAACGTGADSGTGAASGDDAASGTGDKGKSPDSPRIGRTLIAARRLKWYIKPGNA